jgi:putative (di)nucleoside polyphosphate hydrolase
MNKTITHRPCVSVVVLRPSTDNAYEVLLVHKPRKHDAWQVPQGGIEEGESTIQAGKRELMEETNIHLTSEINICPQVYLYDYPKSFIRFQKPRYAGQHLTFVTAYVPRNTVVTVDKQELDDFRWVNTKKIRRYLKRWKYRKVVESAIQWAMKEQNRK